MKFWRPRLSVILVLIHLVILALPLGGIAVLRVYESALIRQTESELIAQAVFISATYRTGFDRLKQSPRYRNSASGIGHPASYVERKAIPEGPWRPRLVKLDLASDPILPPPDEPVAVNQRPAALASAVGRELEPILRDAQVTTLAGIRVLDPAGLIVATTGQDLGLSMANLPEVRRALTGEYVSLIRSRSHLSLPAPLDSISRGSRIRVAVAIPILREGRILGAVTLLRTPSNIWQAIRGKREQLALGGLVMLLIVALLTLFTTITIGRPVRNLIDQARRAGKGESGAVTPLRHPGTREIAELSNTVAAMAQTLEQRAQYIRDFATHVSHEFKTPLTSIRGTVELMRDHGSEMSDAERERFLALLETDTGRLDRLVRRMLELARADTTRERDGAGTADVRALLERICEAQCRRGNDVRLVADTEDKLTTTMPPEALDSIIQSLVDNALQHGGADCQVHLHLGLDQSGGLPGALLIRVSDNGPGVSKNNQHRIFDPFFTTARDRGNTGLGLPIVRALLDAHNGTIRLDSAPEQGARFEVLLAPADLPLTKNSRQ